MHKNVNNLISIQDSLKDNSNKTELPTIIAVSKKFKLGEIIPLINHGHKHFGENQVQEAMEKWNDIKNDFIDIKLHMIGKLQTNKVKYVIGLFDFIHSLDNYKLAEKISNEQIKLNKKTKLFIQVNIGREKQKNGIEINNLELFYKKCIDDFNLDIIGLMCLPPNDTNANKYFLEMKSLSNNLGLKELSMGMSNDYIDATKQGSTFIRVGSKIFGNRPS
tara:strand:- start:494 stop:1150 length:657 start_codon:yes stop_codon:yes gene_type:complete